MDSGRVKYRDSLLSYDYFSWKYGILQSSLTLLSVKGANLHSG